MAFSMESLPYAFALGTCFFFYLIVYPVVVYFRDVNGMLSNSISETSN